MAKVLAQVPPDLISKLPDNVIDTIMMYLPTRDAIRTSILSRNWRYRWTELPQLILDEMLWKRLMVKHSVRITVTMVLYQLLLLHKGPVYKFTLSIPGLESCPETDSLIIFLSSNGIEDLTLKMPINESYRLPSSFLTCQQLKHLTLHSCLIENTFSIQGYKRLVTLKLCEVNVSSEVLGSLISNSPLLEVLELEFSSNNYDLEIHAPNLKTFSFKGFLKAISFRETLYLASVSIFLVESGDGNYNWEGVTRNLVNFFPCLPVLEKLYLNFNFVKSLAEGGVTRWLSTALVYLKYLTLDNIMLGASDELSFILCLMRNSPNLKSVNIQTCIEDADYTSDALEILKDEDESDLMLNELKTVKLQDITGTNSELEFIKLLLSKSPSLKKILIQPGKEIVDKGLQILKQ